MAPQDPAPSCPNEPFTIASDDDLGLALARRLEGTPAEVAEPLGGATTNVYGDIYFHPNNGLHGGWIEAWRLCNQRGGSI